MDTAMQFKFIEQKGASKTFQGGNRKYLYFNHYLPTHPTS
jgi:hypothetical protein